jgi:uncharacterized protein YdhG (YjbR/CyaY superfamily)
MKNGNYGMKSIPPRDVDEYLFDLPSDAQAALQKLRKMIQTILPDAEEAISYQIPTVKYKGRGLIAYAAFKNHCSIFPMSKAIMKTLEKDLASYETSGASGATIHFQPDKMLPVRLLRKIIKARLAEQEQKA